MNNTQVLAAIVSLFLPGVGQLLQGRTQTGLAFLAFWFLAWFTLVLLIGLILIPVVHVWACLDAARWVAPPSGGGSST